MAERLVRERVVVGPVDVPGDLVFARADLELYGINTFRPSFVGHVFFNAPDVDTDALDQPEATQGDSYAGRFALFGHQRCVGDEGHCEQPTTRRRFDDRPSHPLTRAFRRVVVTDAFRRVVASGERLSVTILVIASADDDIEYDGPLLDIDGLQVATFEEP
jgi:hypothetical protein